MSEEKEQKHEEAPEKETIEGSKNVPNEAEIKRVIIVDYTAFNMRGEKVFFGRSMDEVRLELFEACNTAVIHKTIEYDLSVINKVETKVDKPIEITSKWEENTFALLKARRSILKVSKNVINERVAKKLVKRSDDLDDIIMNDKLD